MKLRAGLLILAAGAGAGCSFNVTAPDQGQAPSQPQAAAAPSAAAANAAIASPEKTDDDVRVEVQGASDTGTGGIDGSTAASAGSAQRAAIMDAMRPAIERELRGPVEFVVQRASVRDGWALVVADPQRPGGGRIDPNVVEDAAFRDGLTVNAILRFSGSGWTLVDHAIGPTDVWYCGVDGPPRALTGC